MGTGLGFGLMWPFPNPLDLFGDAVGGAIGWAWDKVIQGIYTWFASGLLMLMEWVWSVLDTATTPRLTEEWFASGLVAPLAGISLAVVVALMIGSGIWAGFGGRPELVADALKEGPKAIFASAVTVVTIDVLVRGADVLADVAWQAGRGDLVNVMDSLAATMSEAGGLAGTFLGPLALLFGMLGLLVTAVVLFMRSALLYLVAAFAPIIWASSVSPVLRGSGRRLVQITVALVLAKPAISVALVVGAKLMANSGTPGVDGEASDGAAALGTLVIGFACFAIAGLSPWVLYRLLPSVEQASVSSGIVGGWGRSAMTAAHGGLMLKSLAATRASAATRPLPAASSGTEGAAGWGGGGPSGLGQAGLSGLPRSGAATGPVTGSSRRPALRDDGPEPLADPGGSTSPVGRQRDD